MKLLRFLFILVISCVFSPRAVQCQTVDARGYPLAKPIGHIVLKKDVQIPDKKTAAFPRLMGNSRFPYLGKTNIGNTGYYLLVLEDVNGCKRPALVPCFDDRGGPSIELNTDVAIMDNTSGLKAYLGYYLLKEGQKLPVISSSKGKYVVRYTSNGCDEHLEVSETDAVFTTIEQERAQERAIEEERSNREREKQIAQAKFVEEQKAKGLVLCQGSWMTPQQATEAEKQRLKTEEERKIAEAKRYEQQQMTQLFSSVDRDYFKEFDQRSYRSLPLQNGNEWNFAYSFGLQDAQTYIITVADWNSSFRRMRNQTVHRNEIAVYAAILDRFSQWVSVAKSQNLTGIEKALGSTSGVVYKFIAPDKLVVVKGYETAEFDSADTEHIRNLLSKAQTIESNIVNALQNVVRSKQIGSQLLK